MPLISVIMPMRNAEPFVHEAVSSVLAQPGVEMELVVVDDGSTDRSAEIVQSFGDPRIRIVPGPRKGIAAALNAGVAEARGEFFARCDSDDWYAPDRFARQLAFLQNNPAFGAVCGKYTLVTESGKVVLDSVMNTSAEEITNELRTGYGRTHLCTYLIRMHYVRELSGFREYFVGTEDSDFLLRLGEQTRIWFEPIHNYTYRLHGESITHTQSHALRDWYERLMVEFQLQRQKLGIDQLQVGRPPPVPNFGTEPKTPEKRIQEELLGRAWKEHRRGNKRDAILAAWKGCVRRPINLKAWRSFVAIVLKRTPRAKMFMLL